MNLNVLPLRRGKTRAFREKHLEQGWDLRKNSAHMTPSIHHPWRKQFGQIPQNKCPSPLGLTEMGVMHTTVLYRNTESIIFHSQLYSFDVFSPTCSENSVSTSSTHTLPELILRAIIHNSCYVPLKQPWCDGWSWWVVMMAVSLSTGCQVDFRMKRKLGEWSEPSVR